MSKPIRYARGGVKVTIGHASTVSLPPRSFHGRLTCMYFDTSKCFLLPTAMTGVRNLRRYYDQHPGLKILVNGHTDKVDTDANNLVLSEERARSIAAFLQDQVDDWLAWYGADKPFGKRWGTREDQYMLATLTDATGALYLAAPISGIPDGAMRDATTRFQQANGLTADGQAGPDTRRALVAQYMAQDGTSLPPGTELLTHGCGESHPIDQTEDADLGNRRVEVFLFDGPIDPPPQSPCRPGGCAEYAQWVAQAIEQIDLCDPTSLDDVTLVIEWPEALTALVPRDLALRLMMGAQTRNRLWTDGVVQDNARRFVFEDLPEHTPGTLVALSNGAELVLWNAQTADDPQHPPVFSHVIEELIPRDETALPAIVVTGPMPAVEVDD